MGWCLGWIGLPEHKCLTKKTSKARPVKKSDRKVAAGDVRDKVQTGVLGGECLSVCVREKEVKEVLMFLFDGCLEGRQSAVVIQRVEVTRDPLPVCNCAGVLVGKIMWEISGSSSGG